MSRMLTVLTFTLFQAALAQGPALRPITVSLLLPLSSSIREQATDVRSGALLALNAAWLEFRVLGFDLRLKSYDDKSDPAEGEKQAQHILEDSDTLTVLGAINSGVTLPASTVFARDSLTLVSPKSTNPKVTERGLENVNRICARDDAQGPAAAEFVSSALGAKSVYVFDDATVYAPGLAELFRKALPQSVKVVGSVSTAASNNYTQIIEDLKALKPDMVYFAADYDQVIHMLKGMRGAGLSSVVVGSDAINTPHLARDAGAAAVGAYFTDIVAPANAYPRLMKEVYSSLPNQSHLVGS